MRPTNEYCLDVYYKDIEALYLRVHSDLELLASVGDIEEIANEMDGALGMAFRNIYENLKSMETTFRAWCASAYEKRQTAHPDSPPVELPLDMKPRSALVSECHKLGYLESDTRGKSVKELRSMILAKREGGVEETVPKSASKPPVKPPIGRPKLASVPAKPTIGKPVVRPTIGKIPKLGR